MVSCPVHNGPLQSSGAVIVTKRWTVQRASNRELWGIGVLPESRSKTNQKTGIYIHHTTEAATFLAGNMFRQEMARHLKKKQGGRYIKQTNCSTLNRTYFAWISDQSQLGPSNFSNSQQQLAIPKRKSRTAGASPRDPRDLPEANEALSGAIAGVLYIPGMSRGVGFLARFVDGKKLMV